MLSPDTVLAGKYRILSVIGQGGYGLVYLALDIEMDRQVAIKELLQDVSQKSPEEWEEYQARFRKEAQLLSRFSHPNVVTAYALERDAQGNYYLIQEYVDGGSVEDRLQDGGPLDIELAISVAIDICKAIEALFRRDIVHRDIKPSNILITSDGVAKLTDLGVAQVGHETRRTQPALAHPGTPAYKSPEQATSTGYVDERSDLYALGLVLYEMLTGSMYVRNHLPPRQHNPHIPQALDAIVMKALKERPAERFQTAQEMRRALEYVRDQNIWAQLRLVAAGVPFTRIAATVGIVALLILFGSFYRFSTALLRTQSIPQSSGPVALGVMAAALPESVAVATWTPLASPTEAVPAVAAMRIAPQSASPSQSGDPWEVDDQDPKPIAIGETQVRSFDPEGDIDRVSFYVQANKTYLLSTANLASGVDTLLEVRVGEQVFTNNNVSPGTLASQVQFTALEDGIALVTVRNQGAYGPTRTYDLTVVQVTLQPTATSTLTPTPNITPRPTFTPLSTPRPTLTLLPTNTRTATLTRTITPTRTDTATPTSTLTPTPTITLTPTRTATRTRTLVPSYTPVLISPTPSATPRPTDTPTPDRTPLPVRTNAPPVR